MEQVMIGIVVDDREARSSRVIEILRQEPGLRISTKRLAVGDFLIPGKVVIERKRIPDFLESLCDGRLFRQAAALGTCGLRGLLVLEGTACEWNRPGIPRSAIQGAMLTLGLVYNLQILRSMDEAETARLLLQAARQLQRTAQPILRRSGFRPKGKRARQLYILTSLPRVGATRARILLQHFGSIEAVITASREELRTLQGIGPHTAEAIYDAVRESIAPYSSL